MKFVTLSLPGICFEKNITEREKNSDVCYRLAVFGAFVAQAHTIRVNGAYLKEG